MTRLRSITALLVLLPGLAAAQGQRVRIDFVRSSTDGELVGGDLRLKLEDADGGRIGWEYLYNDLLGLEFAIASVDHGVAAGSAAETFDAGDFRVTQGTATLQVHLTPGAKVDFYAGGGLAAVQFHDVNLRRGAEPGRSLHFGSDLTWTAQLGLDIPIGHEFGVALGIQYVDSSAKLDGGSRLPLQPWIAGCGLLLRY